MTQAIAAPEAVRQWLLPSAGRWRLGGNPSCPQVPPQSLCHSYPQQRSLDGAGRALEGHGDPPEAGPAVSHPSHRFHLVRIELPGRPQRLALLSRPLQPLPGPAPHGLQFLVGDPSGEQHQDLAEEGLRGFGIGLQVAGPLDFSAIGQRPESSPPGPAARRWNLTVSCPASVRCGRWPRPPGCRPPARLCVEPAPCPCRSWVPVEPETPTSRWMLAKAHAGPTGAAVPGRRGVHARGRPPGAAGWCRYSRKSRPRREYMIYGTTSRNT